MQEKSTKKIQLIHWNSSDLPLSSQIIVKTSLVFVVLIGILDLIGWVLDLTILKSIIENWIPMKIVTAISFIITVSAIVILLTKRSTIFRKSIINSISALICVFSLLTILVYIYTFLTGIEPAFVNFSLLKFFLSMDNRMALITSVNFLLIGCILFLLAKNHSKYSGHSHILIIPVVLTSCFVIVSYILGVYSSHAISDIPVALSTGISFLAISLVILALSPKTWLLKIFTSNKMGGIVARQLLPPLLVLPVIIGWLRINGERSGLFESDEGVVLVALAYVVCFIILVWFTARSIDKIDKQKQDSEKALKESEGRFRTITESMPVQIAITGINDSLIKFTNDFYNQAFGYKQGELVGRKARDFYYNPDDRLKVIETLQLQGYANNIESKVKRADGSPFWVNASIRKITYDGEPAFLSALIDVTERKKAQEELSQLNRTLDALGKSSQAMMHSVNEQQYLNEVCKIITEDCGHKLVWIGYAQNDLQKSVKPMASYGFDNNYLDQLAVTWDDTKTGRGPTGTAIRTGKAFICKNINSDPAFAPWKEEAAKRGYSSSVSLPLKTEGLTIGAISIYSEEPDSFSEFEVSLLSDLADDLSYGIINIRLIESEKDAIKKIKESEERFKLAQKIAHLGSWELDIVGNNLTWSDEVYRIFGLQPQEFNATYEAFLDAIHPDDREKVNKAYSESIRLGKDSYEVEHRVVRKTTGEIRFVHEKCTHIFNEAGGIIKSIGMVHDITDRKKSEIKLMESEDRYRHLFSGMTEGFALHEIILDENGKPYDYRFINVNPAFEKQTGLKVEDIVGKKASEVLPGIEKFWIDTYGKVALTGDSIDFENYFSGLNSYFRVSAFSPKIGFFAVIFENITIRVLAEKELQRTKNYLENLINYANAPIIVWNSEAEIRVFNHAFEHLTGYKSEETIGKKLDFLFPANSLKESNLKIKNALSNNWETIEIPILCKNNEVRTILWNSANIYDTDNETLLSTIAQGNDITERKKAEELLKISHQEWIETFDLIPDLIAIIDTNHRIVKANKAMLNKINISGNDARGLHCYKCIHGDDKPHRSCPHSMMLKDGKQHISDICEIHLGGDFLVSVTPILNAIGEIEGSVHVAHDITSIKKAELELRESREKLDLALDNGNVGVWEWDIVTNSIEWDERMENIFGVAAGSFEGNYAAFEKHLLEEDIPHTNKAISNALEMDIPFETVYRIKLFNKEIRYISAKALVMRDSVGNPLKMQGVCFDITAMKEGAEKALFKLNEDLLRSNKELEQFAYVASHDLQEPLRMVSSFTQLLSMKYKDKLDTEAHEFITFAVDGALRMQNLINDLLEYSRVETKGKPLSEVDMHNVLGLTLSNLSIKIKEKGALVTMGELPTIKADSGQMVQLFQNLIGNALKFSQTAPLVQIEVVEETNFFVFSVKDNGIGIEPQYFERIFQIFQRLHTKEEYGGTGIGLAICRRIVERHGGKIWVESKIGEGTTFHFSIKK